MRKILTFVVAILALSITSCKKDKNETSNPFVGTWKLQEFIDNGVDKTTDCERKSTMVITENAITLNGFYVRRSDNSCVQDEVVEFTYTYTDGKVKNVKIKKTGEMADDFAIFTLENGVLVHTQVDDNSKVVEKYKKQ